MSAPLRRPGGRSARVRQAVNNATLDVLAEHGFDKLTLQEVAARANVNRTTIYRRWPTKGALLADALLSRTTDLRLPDSGNFLSDLMVLGATGPAREETDVIEYSTAISRALDAAGDDPDVAAARQVLWERRLALVRNAVQHAQARREIRDDADPDLIMDVLFGAFHTHVVARGRKFDAEFVDRLFALIQR